MANNDMYLLHRPTGFFLRIAVHNGAHWEGLTAEMDKFFEAVFLAAAKTSEYGWEVAYEVGPRVLELPAGAEPFPENVSADVASSWIDDRMREAAARRGIPNLPPDVDLMTTEGR